MRTLRVLFLLIISCYIIAFSGNNSASSAIEKVDLQLAEGQLAFTFLDLSSGEATLLHHDNGETMLINTGGPGTEDEFRQLLEMYGITKLSSVIVTKEDPEYTSNLEWLTENVAINKIVVGKHSSLHLSLENKNFVAWKSGDTHEVLPGLSISVLQEAENINGSLGMDLLFSFGKHKLLFMTSSNNEVEQSILSKQNLSSVNILKVADFANRNGTSQHFIEEVNPQVAIIFQKRGVLPSQEVIERLHETWIDIYHTKQFGNISIKCSSDDYEIITIPLESNGEVK